MIFHTRVKKGPRRHLHYLTKKTQASKTFFLNSAASAFLQFFHDGRFISSQTSVQKNTILPLKCNLLPIVVVLFVFSLIEMKKKSRFLKKGSKTRGINIQFLAHISLIFLDPSNCCALIALKADLQEVRALSALFTSTPP